MPHGSLAVIMLTMGVITEGERGLVYPEGGGRWGIDIINIPSAAICITQLGSVAMVMATGQLMQK